ncbi:MAG: hypothetical protein R2856_03970 [Caldilineaceae bacterium]
MALDPEEGQAYFLLGNIAESRYDINGAIENYERTFEYSSTPTRSWPSSRVRPGTLPQRRHFLPTDTVEATPSPGCA